MSMGSLFYHLDVLQQWLRSQTASCPWDEDDWLLNMAYLMCCSGCEEEDECTSRLAARHGLLDLNYKTIVGPV